FFIAVFFVRLEKQNLVTAFARDRLDTMYYRTKEADFGTRDNYADNEGFARTKRCGNPVLPVVEFFCHLLNPLFHCHPNRRIVVKGPGYGSSRCVQFFSNIVDGYSLFQN